MDVKVAFVIGFILLQFLACDGVLEKDKESEKNKDSTDTISEEKIMGDRLRHLENDAKTKSETDTDFLMMAKGNKIWKEAVKMLKDLNNLFEIGLTRSQVSHLRFYPGDLSPEEIMQLPERWNKVDADFKLTNDDVVKQLKNFDELIKEQNEVRNDDSIVAKMTAQATHVFAKAEKIYERLIYYKNSLGLHQEEIKELQRKMDPDLQKLTTLVDQKPNIFFLLQNAQQLLDHGFELRKAINVYRQIEGISKTQELDSHQMQYVRQCYNNFAQKIVLLCDANGPQRDQYGQFNLEEVKEKINLEKEKEGKKENKSGGTSEDGNQMPSVLDAEFWAYIATLLQAYHELGLPQIKEVKEDENSDNDIFDGSDQTNPKTAALEFDRNTEKLEKRLHFIESEATMKREKAGSHLIMFKMHELLRDADTLQKTMDTLFRSRLEKDESSHAKNAKNLDKSIKKAREVVDGNLVILYEAINTIKIDKELNNDVLIINALKNAKKMCGFVERLIRILVTINGQEKMNREEANEEQRGMDRSLQELAVLVTHKQPNTFFLLEKTKQVLEQASNLEKEIEEFKKDTKSSKFEKMKPVATAYENFAHNLELLSDGQGPHRDLHGKFSLDEIRRKISLEKEKAKGRTESEEDSSAEENIPTSLMDAHFWLYFYGLLQQYYNLNIPLMGQIKIHGLAGTDHVVLIVGLTEYYFLESDVGMKRRKLRQELTDEYTSATSWEKAAPLVGNALAVMKEVDKIFFNMVELGWNVDSYNKNHRFSGTFVWKFVCKLHDKCPAKEGMPANFRHLDEKVQIISALVWQHESPRQFLKNVVSNCELKQRHQEVQIKLDVLEMKKESISLEKPFIIQYTTSKYSSNHKLHHPLSIQEQFVEVFPSGQPAAEVRFFEAKLTVYSCGKHDSIQNIHIFDQAREYQVTNEKGGRILKGENKVDFLEAEEIKLKVAVGTKEEV